MANDKSTQKRATSPDLDNTDGENGATGGGETATILNPIAWDTLEQQLNALQTSQPDRRIVRVFATCTPQRTVFQSVISGAEVIPAENPPRVQFSDGEIVEISVQ